MVLQAEIFPSFGPQQGYSHSQYYKNDYYNNGATRKEDYSYKDHYSSSSSMHMRPSQSFHSSYGSSNHGSGYGGHHSSSAHGGFHSSSGLGHGMYMQHGSMNHGFGGNHFGSHMTTGPSQFEERRYEYQHNKSTGPYYAQHSNSSWVSKDLDD